MVRRPWLRWNEEGRAPDKFGFLKVFPPGSLHQKNVVSPAEEIKKVGLSQHILYRIFLLINFVPWQLHTYAMYSDYSLHIHCLSSFPSLSTLSPALPVHFSDSWLLLPFCDPLSLTCAISVNILSQLSTGAWWSHQSVWKWRQWPLSLSEIIRIK